MIYILKSILVMPSTWAISQKYIKQGMGFYLSMGDDVRVGDNVSIDNDLRQIYNFKQDISILYNNCHIYYSLLLIVVFFFTK